MIQLVLSGGQTGVDQAGWRAARTSGLITGGWMPLGFLTEDGPRPDFAALYCAKEHSSSKYPPRTYANVHDSDGTLWLGAGDSAGFGCTEGACNRLEKPMLTIVTRSITPERAVLWLHEFGIKALNVAGNRESKNPGIGVRAEAFLVEMFACLKAMQEGQA